MAIRFDSNADSLIGAPPSSRYTLAGWMYISVDTNTFATLAEICIAIGTNFHEFQTDADGTTMGFNDHTAGFIVTDPTTQAVGEWWFNAVVVSNSGTAIYQMKEGGTSLVKTSSATTAESFTPDQYMLGSDIFSEFLNGRLRGVKLWNGVALTDTELDLEKNQFAPVRTANLWSYYKLKDVATMLLDTSGNGRNLTNPSGTGTWTEEADPNVPETLATTKLRSIYANGSDSPLGYVEPIDPNNDRLLVQGIYPQGSSPTAVNFTAGVMQDPSRNLQLQDVIRMADLNQIAATGFAGATGFTGLAGVTGVAMQLQTLYDASTIPRIIETPTQGALYITDPSGGVSGGFLFLVQNGVSASPTSYFRVSPTGILTSGRVIGKRIDLNGIPLVPANFSLGRIGSGNGQTNSQYGVTNIRGDDSHAIFTVVVGQTGYTINPIVTLNFPSFPGLPARRANAPFIVSKLTSPMSPTNSSSTGGPTGMGYESSLVETTVSPTNIQWMLRAAVTAKSYFTISFIALA